MKCPHCATPLSEECHFCPQCGEPIGAPEETAAPVRRVAARTQSIAPSRSLVAVAAPPVTSDKEVHALLTQANLCRMRRQFTEAIDHCVAALQARPGDAMAHSLLGDIYRDQGKTDEAIQWYRMAVDLAQNPSDETKLRQQERERENQIARRSRTGYTSRSRLLTAADGRPAGTTNLMGISPRHWLRGITIASLGFVALMIVALMTTRHRPRSTTIISTPPPSTSVTANTSPPPTSRSGAASSTNGERRGPVVAGTGLPPDRTATPRLATPRNPSLPLDTQASSLPAGGVPTAPITAVKPLDNPPGSDAATTASTDPTSLPNGARILLVNPDHNAGNAAVLVSVPILPNEAQTETNYTLLLRTIYNAARGIFATDSAVSRLTVSIQSDSGAAPLLTAEIDRAIATAARPESDSPDRLQSGLTSLKWMNGSTSPETPPANGNQGADASAPSPVGFTP